MKFRFLTPAETEMMEAAAYYEMQVERLGINFLDIIEAAVIEIARIQQYGQKLNREYKDGLYAGFPIPFSMLFMKMRLLLWQLCIKNKNPVTGWTDYRFNNTREIEMETISDIVKIKTGYANFVELKSSFEQDQENIERMAMYRSTTAHC